MIREKGFFSKEKQSKLFKKMKLTRFVFEKTIKLIAMIKMGKILYLDCLSEKEINAQELRKKYRGKAVSIISAI